MNWYSPETIASTRPPSRLAPPSLVVLEIAFITLLASISALSLASTVIPPAADTVPVLVKSIEASAVLLTMLLANRPLTAIPPALTNALAAEVESLLKFAVNFALESAKTDNVPPTA